MVTVTFKDAPVRTSGQLPKLHSKACDFKLVRKDLSEATLESYQGKKKLLNVFPSLDTSVCSIALKKFYEKIGKRSDIALLNISMDLPFAQKRFCTAENIDAEVLSSFRSSFAKDYGLQIAEGPLMGLCSRAVIVLDESNQVVYTEQVSEMAHEPNYEAALKALNV